MPDQQEEYKGNTIVVSEEGDVPGLKIGDADIEVSVEEGTGRYSSPHLPYTDYPSVSDLAKQIIDVVPGFRTE